jgi:hypothetical protein
MNAGSHARRGQPVGIDLKMVSAPGRMEQQGETQVAQDLPPLELAQNGSGQGRG